MATVHIICGRHYDLEKGQYTVGGIQTYITQIRKIIHKMGLNCVLYQRGTREDRTALENATLVTVKTDEKAKDLQYVRKALTKCEEFFDDSQDILLFSTDTRILPNKASRSIAIQHGIYWDMPVHENFNDALNELYIFSKARLARRIISNLKRVKQVVCVDHNFPNWLRATCAYQNVKLNVIPNFTEISDKNKKPDDVVNIIFARRFEKYRGTRIFSEAIKRILKEYDNVRVTFAGTGPDEKYLKDAMADFSDKVEFIKYKSGESLKVHSNKHIAVIPTVGSEGTSLSLLEAMSAQCAVVCTDVGGMSNIVLDSYNGIISDRTAESLYESLKVLIDDSEKRNKIAEKGYETVKEAFSYEIWAKKWMQIFKGLM